MISWISWGTADQVQQGYGRFLRMWWVAAVLSFMYVRARFRHCCCDVSSEQVVGEGRDGMLL